MAVTLTVELAGPSGKVQSKLLAARRVGAVAVGAAGLGDGDRRASTGVADGVGVGLGLALVGAGRRRSRSRSAPTLAMVTMSTVGADVGARVARRWR